MALYPVKDFRTDSITSDSATLNQKQAVPQVFRSAVVDAATVDYNTLPVVQLTDSSFIITTDSSKSIYYLNVTVRDSKTDYNPTFPLLLDTGSSMTWIYNESCSSGPCANALKFDDSKGLSLQSSDTFQLGYSGDVVSGDIISTNGTDVEFFVESTIDQEIALNNISVGLALTSPSIFDGYNISGVIGIPSTYTTPNKNIIHQLYTQGIINEQVFLVILNSNNSLPTYTKESNNEYTAVEQNFGGIMFLGNSENPFNSSTVSVDVVANSNSYWLINITNVESVSGVGGVVTPLDASNNSSGSTFRQAIIDTGTTGIVLPMQDADNLHKGLFGNQYITDNQGNYAFPCTNQNSTIIFTSDDECHLNISSSYFTGDAYTTLGLTGYCASKIQGTADGNNGYWVLGAAFLSQYYTTFNLAQGTIEFSQLSESSFIINPSSSSSSSSSTTPASSSIASSGLLAHTNATTLTTSATSTSTGKSNNGTSSSGNNASKNGGSSLTTFSSRSILFVQGLLIVMCSLI